MTITSTPKLSIKETSPIPEATTENEYKARFEEIKSLLTEQDYGSMMAHIRGFISCDDYFYSKYLACAMNVGCYIKLVI